MKLLGTIITLFCVLFIFSCTKKTTNMACFDADLKEVMEDSNCIGVSQGVCGCDGNTYVNECAANKAGYIIIDTVPCSQRR